MIIHRKIDPKRFNQRRNISSLNQEVQKKGRALGSTYLFRSPHLCPPAVPLFIEHFTCWPFLCLLSSPSENDDLWFHIHIQSIRRILGTVFQQLSIFKNRKTLSQTTQQTSPCVSFLQIGMYAHLEPIPVSVQLCNNWPWSEFLNSSQMGYEITLNADQPNPRFINKIYFSLIGEWTI